jgi:hypothetical protein
MPTSCTDCFHVMPRHLYTHLLLCYVYLKVFSYFQPCPSSCHCSRQCLSRIKAELPRDLWFIFNLRINKRGRLITCTHTYISSYYVILYRWLFAGLNILERLRCHWCCCEWVHPGLFPKVGWSPSSPSHMAKDASEGFPRYWLGLACLACSDLAIDPKAQSLNI